jgi:enoyl-CoA hydratase/carnithine racemase
MFSGAGGKAFCAGGDIKSLYDAKSDPSKTGVHDSFFREEYILDYSIAKMKAIQVAILDGIVMGGGVGISANAPIKIATENSVFAMPGNVFSHIITCLEAKIGLFTDVGGGYFLSRLRSNLGFFLGLTGQRLKGAELVQVGFAHYYVKKEKLVQLEAEIIEKTNDNTKLDDVVKIVEKYQEKVELKYPNEEFIKQTFGKGSVQDIYKALKEASDKNEMAGKLVKQMDSQCPISMAVIHEQIKRGGKLDLAENFKMDFRIVQR